MLDIVNLHPPPVLKELEDEARVIHFTMGSDYQTGALLRVLAASKPGGTLLELERVWAFRLPGCWMAWTPGHGSLQWIATPLMLTLRAVFWATTPASPLRRWMA